MVRRGIIAEAIRLGIKRGKSMGVVRRFLRLKYNIKIPLNLIKKRL